MSWFKVAAARQELFSSERPEAKVRRLTSAAYTIPTATKESDGTLVWDSTTLVAVHAEAEGETGFGYTYSHAAAAKLIADKLREVIEGADALDIPCAWKSMIAAVRNLGRPGIASAAISAVDSAMWDLKARILGLPLASLLGQAREAIPAYGSGGFTSYSIDQLREQFSRWSDEGFRMMKMKVGREPDEDIGRVRAARKTIGDDALLMVDANGAYSRKQALEKALAFAYEGVGWFEEPVSSDDLEGLRLLRDNAPPGMEIAAGEYGDRAVYFRRMLEAQAIDVLQADGTRCGGVTGFLEAAALCRGFLIPLSAHTAPSIHAAPSCSALEMRHIEYFYDHARLEGMLFDGALQAHEGRLSPNRSRPGAGFDLKQQDAAKYQVFSGSEQ